ncbi:terminase small subunit [Escherichia coli]
MRVNKKKLAEIFDVDVRTISTWQNQGLPLISGGGKGNEAIFDTGKAIEWFAQREALSKLARQISSIMDSLPLTMQRSFPQMTPAMLDGLKKEVVRACNACTKLDENIPRMLSDYLMETTGNVPDKFQPDKDK